APRQSRRAGRHPVRVLSGDAWRLHRATRHGSVVDAADRVQLVAFGPLDPSNRPAPFKRYVGRESVPLTRDFGRSGARAADVLSGSSLGVVDTWWDGERLARLLFFSNGVSRTSRSTFGDATYFRTGMSAGNLHPVELYVVCGDLDDVGAGVYHFAPLEFGLTALRRGDYRGALAAATAGAARTPARSSRSTSRSRRSRERRSSSRSSPPRNATAISPTSRSSSGGAPRRRRSVRRPGSLWSRPRACPTNRSRR